MSELLVLQQECDQATQIVSERLAGCGLQVVRSFDLRQAGKLPTIGAACTNEQLALTPPVGCHCTYHGTEPCDCQMVVLLVYGPTAAPATLVAHGHDGLTWFTLVDTPEQRPSPTLVKSITAALHTPPSPLTLEARGASYKTSTIK
jgi:hypothetical protein